MLNISDFQKMNQLENTAYYPDAQIWSADVVIKLEQIVEKARELMREISIVDYDKVA